MPFSEVPKFFRAITRNERLLQGFLRPVSNCLLATIQSAFKRSCQMNCSVSQVERGIVSDVYFQ